MKFLCYKVQSRDPEVEEQVGHCIMGNGKIWTGLTLEQAQSQVIRDNILAEFTENCGWILEGEEEKLLDPDFQDILLFTIQMNHPEMSEV